MLPPRPSHLIALALLIPLGGCGPTIVRTGNPVPVTRQEYDRVFDAAIAVLRDRGFVLSRQDRRFGVITTLASPASTILEPWRDDNTTGRQALANTLNHRRRIVRVDLKQRADADPAEEDAGAAAAIDYQLAVAVRLEQRQHPPRHLHTAAASSVAHYGRSAGARRLLTAAGAETSFWRPIGRDAYLEQRLIAAILNRAAAGDPAPPDRDDERARGGATVPAPRPAALSAKDDARS